MSDDPDHAAPMRCSAIIMARRFQLDMAREVSLSPDRIPALRLPSPGFATYRSNCNTLSLIGRRGAAEALAVRIADHLQMEADGQSADKEAVLERFDQLLASNLDYETTSSILWEGKSGWVGYL